MATKCIKFKLYDDLAEEILNRKYESVSDEELSSKIHLLQRITSREDSRKIATTIYAIIYHYELTIGDSCSTIASGGTSLAKEGGIMYYMAKIKPYPKSMINLFIEKVIENSRSPDTPKK